MSIFYDKLKCMEREDNNVMEILLIIDAVSESLSSRYTYSSLFYSILIKLRQEDKDAASDKFVDYILSGYQKPINECLKEYSQSLRHLQECELLDLKLGRELEYEWVCGKKCFLFAIEKYWDKR